MTREEMKELTGLAASMGLYDDKNPCKRAVILGKAIKALEQEPCEDAISRQAVLEKQVYTETEEGWSGYTVDAEYIKSLPSVQPKQKTGEWIPVSERLPEEKINPITQDFYEYQCTFFNDGIYDVRSYKFGKGHWWHGAGIMDDYVVAWRQRPEPYMMEG